MVNVGDLATLFPQGGTVGVAELVAAGAVRKGHKVKVLGDGDLNGVVINLTVDAASGSAKEKIGGPAAASPPPDLPRTPRMPRGRPLDGAAAGHPAF